VLLPNADRAVVEDAKVRDYLLSPSHPVGRFKSVFFIALGFSLDQWQILRDALLSSRAVATQRQANRAPSDRSSRSVLPFRDLRVVRPLSWWSGCFRTARIFHIS